MSATTISPHKARPGISRWPGFLRKKVTVSVGRACRIHAPARRAIKARRHIDGDNGHISIAHQR